jgi:hypothetical protein
MILDRSKYILLILGSDLESIILIIKNKLN